MAFAKTIAPMRGSAYRLRWPSRHDALLCRSSKSFPTSYARTITTSTSSRASITPVEVSKDNYVPVKPFEEQTVLATIHRFPSLEPLRFETYPANHLYLPTRKDILHRAITYEGDMTRLGTASTKTRYEVHGSRRKIRPQKGSGRARLGDKKSPMLRGGGVAFGPKPRDFSTELQKKVYDLAWRTALSYRYRKGELIIVDNAMEIESPSTRLLQDIFKHHEKLRGKGRSLLVTLEERPLLEQALVEMDRGEQTLTWEEIDVKNLLELSRVIIERDALHNILLSHQEDLTHKALTPWHKSLVRSSPAEELEAQQGWAEFRTLSLADAEDRDAARVSAYESTASARYATAESLPEGPKRTELSISAYNLLAEAKELQFAKLTGVNFREYVDATEKLDVSEVSGTFPRVQALDYQISVKSDLAEAAAESSRPKGEAAMVEVGELQVQKLELKYEAALLAAQVHEHVAEAQLLAGEQDAAAESMALASAERTNVDALELQVLESKLEVAKQKDVAASLRRDFAGSKKAKTEMVQLQEAVEAKRAENEAWESQAAELDEAEAESIAQEEAAILETKEPIVEVKEPAAEAKKEEKK